jgi:hypothetical protein
MGSSTNRLDLLRNFGHEPSINFDYAVDDTAHQSTLRGYKTQMDNIRLIPVTEWNKYHSWPPIGGLRHLIFYGNQNGFNHCIRRVGRRVLIDEAAFFEWVAQCQNPATRKGVAL